MYISLNHQPTGHHPYRFSLFSVASIITFSITPCHAQQPNIPSVELEPSVKLEPIVVTATRIPTKVDNLIAQTTIIDSQDLQRYQGQSVFEVIKNQPDISHFSYGGMGTANNFYLRGYDSKQILVLIDGIRYGSLSTGQPALNLLPVEQIERIEILKGASGSSIYGADAMGGVIQIFSKKGADIANNKAFSVTIGAGSNDHYLYGATANLTNEHTQLSLSASHTQSKGINATTADNSYSYHSDKDGFDSDNLSLALQHKLSDQLDIGITGLYAEAKVDYDQGANVDDVYNKQKNGAAQAYVQYQYADNSAVKLQYGISIDKQANYNADNNTGTFNTQQTQASLTGHHQLANAGTLIYGLEHLKQTLDSSQYSTEDRKINSIFTGYQLSKDKLDIQANARYDKNSQYGNETTYNLGLAYQPFANTQLANVRIGAGYATGFRAPNFNDLYYPSSGNPKLKAETSKNKEIFAEYDGDNHTSRITAYQNKLSNKIAWKRTNPNVPNDWSGLMKNIDKIKIKGISLTSDWNINNYLFGLGYDYQKTTDDNANSPNHGKSIYYHPKHKGLVYAGYQANDFDIRAEYQYTGDYYTDNSNLDKLDGYGLVNFAGNYYLNDHLTLNGRINNLTNKDYVSIKGYNTDGTNVFVSLRYDY